MTTASEPAWLSHARTLLGTREARGTANNASILDWAKLLGAKVLGMATTLTACRGSACSSATASARPGSTSAR